MPKQTVIQSNFTAGEISPRLLGRFDIANYQNAAKTMENVVPVQHGGARRRDGTKFIAEVADSTQVTRLIPFVYSKDEAYVLEFGDRYMRVYRNGAQVLDGASPYEIVTPYLESQLAEIDYTQGENTMFLFQGDTTPRRLRRFDHDHWVLDSVPFVVRPFAEVGQPGSGNLSLTSGAVGMAITATSSANTFRVSDVGREITYLGGAATITAYTSATEVDATVTVEFIDVTASNGTWRIEGSPVTTCTPDVAGPVGAVVTLTLPVAGWRIDTMNVYYVRINGGLIKLDGGSYTGSTQVDGIIMKPLTGTTAADAGAWSLERELWEASTGYPRTGTIHEQRLICGGTETYPQTIWGSRIGEYLNFTIGTDDDDGFAFTIASDQANPIAYLASARTLIALTYGGEFTIEGGVEKPITPTNVQIKMRSNRGCAQVRQLRVENEEFFVQRSGKKVLAFGYSATAYDWAVSDVALLSEHLITPGIVELAYQQDPDPTVYAVRSDGMLAVCAFSREQDVSGWVKWDLGGEVKSVAVIPTATSESAYVIVERVIDGNTVQYVEIITPDLFLDCAITGTSGPGATTWSGLDHLEGETVGVIADGYFAGEFTVTSGEIELPESANEVSIGLRYTPTIEPLSPDIGGYAQGNSVRVGEVSLRFLETTNCQVNGDEIDFRQLGTSLLDQPLEPFTGIKRVESLGWNRGDAEMTITANYPFSFHLLSLIRKITVND
jgi:hypothetical protein